MRLKFQINFTKTHEKVLICPHNDTMTFVNQQIRRSNFKTVHFANFSPTGFSPQDFVLFKYVTAVLLHLVEFLLSNEKSLKPRSHQFWIVNTKYQFKLHCVQNVYILLMISIRYRMFFSRKFRPHWRHCCFNIEISCIFFFFFVKKPLLIVVGLAVVS